MVWYWFWDNSNKARDLGTVVVGIIRGLLLLWRSISAEGLAQAAVAQVAQDQIARHNRTITLPLSEGRRHAEWFHHS